MKIAPFTQRKGTHMILYKGYANTRKLGPLFNKMRMTIDPFEESYEIERLSKTGMPQREIGRKLGISQSTVGRKLALLKASAEVKSAVRIGQIPLTAAELLGFNPEEIQNEALRIALEGKDRVSMNLIRKAIRTALRY